MNYLSAVLNDPFFLAVWGILIGSMGFAIYLFWKGPR